MADPLTPLQRRFVDRMLANDKVAVWLEQQRPKRSGYFHSDAFKGTLMGSILIPSIFTFCAFIYDHVAPTSRDARVQAENREEMDELTKLMPMALTSDDGKRAVQVIVDQRCRLKKIRQDSSWLNFFGSPLIGNDRKKQSDIWNSTCGVDPAHPENNSLYATFLFAVGKATSNESATEQHRQTDGAGSDGGEQGVGKVAIREKMTDHGTPLVSKSDGAKPLILQKDATQGSLDVTQSPSVVYIQYYLGSQRSSADRLRQAFQAFGVSAPGYENVCDVHGIDSNVCKHAISNQIVVRYFQAGDAQAADFAAKVVARILPGRKIATQDLSGRNFVVTPGLVEIWLPKD